MGDIGIMIGLYIFAANSYINYDSNTKRYTVDNNLNATHNILAAIVESKKDIHLEYLAILLITLMNQCIFESTYQTNNNL